MILTVDIKDTEASVEDVCNEIASWLSDLYKTEVTVYGSFQITVGGNQDGLQTT